MRRPGKRVVKILLAILVAPVLLWAAVVFLLPLKWARNMLVANLARETRQDVRLDSVRIGFFGGVELVGLRFAAPSTPENPWMKADSIAVDVSLRELLTGRIEPSACRANGVSLRVHRDADGNLEFGDFLTREKAKDSGNPTNSEVDDHELIISLDGATILVQDEQSGANLEFTQVHGRASITRSTAAITELAGYLNGGTFEFAATADRSMFKELSAHVMAQGVNLDVGTKPMAMMVPLLASVSENGQARAVLGLDAQFRGRATSSEALGRTLTGSGKITLDDLSLEDSRIFREVQAAMPVPTLSKLGSLKGQFAIADRRVSTNDTVLRVAEVPINLTGWSDFDGKLNYLVKCEKLGKAVSKIAGRLPMEARELLAELPIEDLNALAGVRVSGTIDHPSVTPAHPAAASRPATSAKAPDRRSDKAKLKEAGRRFLDRVIR